MAATLLADVSNQIQKNWAPKFTKEFRESHLLGSLVNKEYTGDIKQGGDTVYVSQINAPEGQLRTVGTDADVFSSSKVSMTRIAITADKRAVASYEFEDLVMIQSQLDKQDSEIKASLMFALQQSMNEHLYSKIAPSTSAPDHLIGGTSAFGKTQIVQGRKLAGAAKWDKIKPWYMLLDPTYYSDVLADTTLTSGDYVGDMPVVAGQIAMPRFGFNVLEDNSAGLLTADQGATATEKVGVAFHPDWLHLVQQTEVQVKISDLHPTGKFGFKLSVDLVFGAALGISGASKHIVWRATA